MRHKPTKGRAKARVVPVTTIAKAKTMAQLIPPAAAAAIAGMQREVDFWKLRAAQLTSELTIKPAGSVADARDDYAREWIAKVERRVGDLEDLLRGGS